MSAVIEYESPFRVGRFFGKAAVSIALTHPQARVYVTAALATLGLPVTTATAQLLQAVGWLETRYSAAWKAPGQDSLNWGAIQCCKPPCPVNAFQYTDTTPQADGTNKPYSICFKAYTSHTEAVIDLARTVYVKRQSVLKAALRNDAYGFSEAMYDTVYYQGWGSTREQRIAHHHKAVMNSVYLQARALNEKVVGTAEVPIENLRLRSPRMSGAAVASWQRSLNKYPKAKFQLTEDGVYGLQSEKATIKFQTLEHLTPDGIVGPKTRLIMEQYLNAIS